MLSSGLKKLCCNMIKTLILAVLKVLMFVGHRHEGELRRRRSKMQLP